ncbi:hypothetical protein ACWC5I_11910 [Kitasatospora sp. NPDC001574]
MVEKVLTLKVCNTCERPGVPVRRYTLAEGDRAVFVDLCEEDSKPVEAVMATGEPVAGHSPAASQSGGRPGSPASGSAPAKKTAAKKTAVKKTAVKKTAAKKAPAARTKSSVKATTLDQIEALRHGS